MRATDAASDSYAGGNGRRSGSTNARFASHVIIRSRE
jgi:hypothetical protein